MIRKPGIIWRALAMRAAALAKCSRIAFGATIYIHRGAVFRIGRGVRIGKGTLISVLPGATLMIHDGCIINNGSYIQVQDRVEIGQNTRIAHYCSIVDHDYDFRESAVLNDSSKTSAPIVIGSNVWLGAYVMLLKGVRIGDGAIVGAKALVTKSIPERSVAYCRACSELTIKRIEAP
jgi:acetyltransferase-like isoleucine patch superfamily enzyme